MIHFAAAEVAQLESGDTGLYFSTLFLDITGIVASGALVTAGFFHPASQTATSERRV
jgi:hypothetical protein